MNFKDYFGINLKDVKENCILCQSYDLSLFAQKSNNGFFVKTAQTKNATIIALKNNFLAGDTVLQLKGTQCKNIFLFGSCGGVGDVTSGDLLMIDKAFNLESFSKMLGFDKNPEHYFSSQSLMRTFYNQNKYEELIKTNSACVSSLILEEQYVEWFKENGVSAVDMESSIVFSTAKKIKIDAVCLMYVADHIETDKIGDALSAKTKQIISQKRAKLSKIILDFINGR